MRIPPAATMLPLDELGTVHLVGIGGAGLSAIARLLAQQGVRVQGSDAQDSVVLESLRAEGIECFVGQAAENIGDAATVIASTAVREDNPEIREAYKRGLRLWPRSSGLMAAMQDDKRVAISGTHGKTTTTAMTTCAVRAAGLDPSFAIGASVAALGTNAKRGTSPVMVVEADESDGAFLHYAPAVAVITNVDADHLDVYGSVEAYENAFVEFLGTVTESVVLCADDPVACRLSERVPAGLRVRTAGFEPGADVLGSGLEVVGARTRFRITTSEASVDCELSVPGIHYARDALLAVAAGVELGLDLERLVAGLADYTGADRRMQTVAELTYHGGEVLIIDSYAHHPSEIRADIAAARQVAGQRRLVVVFQPHLVSRTRVFGARMGEELSAADLVVLADLYLAREDPDPQVTTQRVADTVSGTDVVLAGPVSSTHLVVAEHVRPGDVVLTLGAGDITEVGPRLAQVLGAGA